MSEKKTILVVDDNTLSLTAYIEVLEDCEFTVKIATSLNEAKRKISESQPHLVVIDIMLPVGPEDDVVAARGGLRAGWSLARWIRINYPMLPFMGISRGADQEVVEWFVKFGRGFVNLADTLPLKLAETITQILSGTKVLHKSLQIFIVHGHDEVTKLQLKNYLQNSLNLPEPIILHERPSLGRTIIEKFEEESKGANLVFVLLTPDDIMGTSEEPNEVKRRSRQNVIFELGYFYGKLNRRSGRVLLLYKQDIELPSDISGLVYIDIKNGVESAGESIRREIADYI